MVAEKTIALRDRYFGHSHLLASVGSRADASTGLGLKDCRGSAGDGAAEECGVLSAAPLRLWTQRATYYFGAQRQRSPRLAGDHRRSKGWREFADGEVLSQQRREVSGARRSLGPVQRSPGRNTCPHTVDGCAIARGSQGSRHAGGVLRLPVPCLPQPARRIAGHAAELSSGPRRLQGLSDRGAAPLGADGCARGTLRLPARPEGLLEGLRCDL